MWLGHQWGLAPKIDWNPEHFFRFRKYWPYNGGVATDLLYHFLAPLLIAISGSDGEFPRRVNAGGGLYIINDGREIPDLAIPQSAYPKGDAFVCSIAAASIVAKVHRDAIMCELDVRYPGYGFARHMGYSTRAHFAAIRTLGPSPIHRRSFAPVRQALGLEPIQVEMFGAPADEE